MIQRVSAKSAMKGSLMRQQGAPHMDPARDTAGLHSRRDRFGTIRTDLVDDLRFRVRSYVILEGLPIALLILYLFARQTDGQKSL